MSIDYPREQRLLREAIDSEPILSFRWAIKIRQNTLREVLSEYGLIKYLVWR